MTTVQTVREEHAQFLPHLEEIARLADAVGSISAKRLLARAREVHEFLAHRLIPHAVAEGRLLLPMVRRLPDGSELAARMNRCHVRVGELTDRLDATIDRAARKGLDDEAEGAFRDTLREIHTLLADHFAEAEEVFTAAIGPEAAPAEVFEAVERTAHEVSDTYE